MGTVVRYLEDEEKIKSRTLWEEAFPEDSREFADYYFREKIKDNKILVKEEDGSIISMLHRNPYLVKIKDHIASLDYIVGVATRQERRHEGHMRDLLTAMMKDMYEERVPFTFLMPASEKIYYPFDFRFIFSQPIWTAEHSLYREISRPAGWLQDDEKEAEAIGRWMNRWLESRYQVYAVRTPSYIKRLDEEVASEKGLWTFLYEGNQMAGILCEWGLKEREQRLCYGEDLHKIKERPAIMGRIICLEEFAKNISLKEQCPADEIEVTVKVEDRFLEGNNGLWRWKLDKRTSSMEKISSGDIKGQQETAFSIGEMIEWLSGYKPMKKAEWMEQIQPLQGIFLDEIV